MKAILMNGQTLTVTRKAMPDEFNPNIRNYKMNDTAEKRQVKKLTIEITDQEALLAAYPALKMVVEKVTVDRSKLRPIVKAMQGIGATVPGVNAYYANETEGETSAASEEVAA
jgi:hypothetical protein